MHTSPLTRLPRYYLWALFIALSVVVAGCNSPAEPEPSENTVLEEVEPPKPDFNGVLPGEPGYISERAPKVVLTESYEDVAKWTVPRVQIHATLKGDKTDTIWTHNYDGSDKRQVVGADMVAQLGEGNGWIGDEAVRSPDSRYIIASYVESLEGGGVIDGIALFDLKERRARLVVEGGSSFLNWFPDSERFMANVEGYIKQYNITTDTLTDMPQTGSSTGFTLMPDGKRLFIRTTGGYVFKNIMAPKGTLEATHQFGPKMGNNHPILSPDRKRLLFPYGRNESKALYIEVDTGKVISDTSSREVMKFSTYQGVRFTHRPNELMVLGSINGERIEDDYLFWRFFNITTQSYYDVPFWKGTNLDLTNLSGGGGHVIIPPHLRQAEPGSTTTQP